MPSPGRRVMLYRFFPAELTAQHLTLKGAGDCLVRALNVAVNLTGRIFACRAAAISGDKTRIPRFGYFETSWGTDSE